MHIHLRAELLPGDDHTIDSATPVPRLTDRLVIARAYKAQNLQATVIKAKHINILGWIFVENQRFRDNVSFGPMPSGVDRLNFAGAGIKIPYLETFIASTSRDPSERRRYICGHRQNLSA